MTTAELEALDTVLSNPGLSRRVFDEILDEVPLSAYIGQIAYLDYVSNDDALEILEKTDRGRELITKACTDIRDWSAVVQDLVMDDPSNARVVYDQLQYWVTNGRV